MHKKSVKMVPKLSQSNEAKTWYVEFLSLEIICFLESNNIFIPLIIDLFLNYRLELTLCLNLFGFR